jgi:hypothetical protein
MLQSFSELIDYQGNSINRIDKSITESDIDIEDGTNDINKAEEINNSINRKIIYATSDILIGGLLGGGIGALINIPIALIGSGIGSGTGFIIGIVRSIL